MKPYEPAAIGVSTVDRLDQISMSPNELRMARASMRQAELIVDMLIHAHDGLRHVVGSIGRGIGALARRNKVSPVAPTWQAP
jgi:hypothetical protein